MNLSGIISWAAQRKRPASRDVRHHKTHIFLIERIQKGFLKTRARDTPLLKKRIVPLKENS